MVREKSVLHSPVDADPKTRYGACLLDVRWRELNFVVLPILNQLHLPSAIVQNVGTYMKLGSR
jgi:hypothetical protein